MPKHRIVDENWLFVAFSLKSNDLVCYFAWMNTQWYTKKWVGISLHGLFWILFFISPLLLRPVMDNKASLAPSEYRSFFFLHFLNNLMRMALFYSNAYILIPRLIYKKKYGQYVLILLISLLILLFWDRLIFSLLITGHRT